MSIVEIFPEMPTYLLILLKILNMETTVFII